MSVKESREEVIDRTVRELRAESEIDFIDLSFIVGCLYEDLYPADGEEIRSATMEVVIRLMSLGVHPGDYTLDDLRSGRGFQFRPGTPEEHLSWIESEWTAMGHLPTIEEPICWFALKR